MSYVLVLGAKSDIAKALALKYAMNGYDLYLAARNCVELEEFANDIKVRTQRTVSLVELDILDFESHQSVYNKLQHRPLGVISAIGYLKDQQTSQSSLSEVRCILDTNYTGIVSFLSIVANDFQECKQGFIIGISSVAGDRGRKSNYLYGSAKAGLTAFLSGLRNRLHSAGVQVLTVKPGFVETKMTENMNLPKALTAQPELVAKDIYEAQVKGYNVVYTKWIWRYIMFFIKLVPEKIFKGLNL